MLAVDRQDATSSPLSGREREVACRDEALLVGKREIDSTLESGQRGGKAGEPDYRIQDDVRRRGVDEQVERGLTPDRDVLDASRGGDLSRLVPTVSGGDGAQL